MNRTVPTPAWPTDPMKPPPHHLRHRTAIAPTMVAEMQGLYGPYTFSELLLQRIWARREFDDTTARTADGREVRILAPGKWNRLGGPDFLDARLQLNGRELAGDVELHLHAGDWAAHAHAQDPAYANVVLHAVLFPADEHFTLGTDGREIPMLTLLPLLPRGLEEYAEDEAVESLSRRPLARVPAELAELALPELRELLAAHARQRWEQKVQHARQRIARLGWENACHHTALEILGYRFNRVPMLTAATRFPVAAWRQGAGVAESAWAAQPDGWRTQGVRPLNHPRLRLRQYAAWAGAQPDWPTRLRKLAAAWPTTPAEGTITVAQWRRTNKFPEIRDQLADGICGGTVGGSRFDTLVCDGFLPLLAAETGADLGGWWQAWFPGDLPEAVLAALRILGVFSTPGQPACHGPAQGLLAWLLVTPVTVNAPARRRA